MRKLLAGIDISFGKGVGFDEIVEAIASCTPIDRRAIVLYGADDYIDVVKYGKWAWVYEIPEEKDYPFMASIELNDRTDFKPIIIAIQKKLQVNISIPDEENPLPNAMITYLTGGGIKKYYLP